jgi:hypothetical protein
LSRSLILAAVTFAIALVGCGSPSSSKPAAVVNSHDISMTSFNQEYRYECVNAVTTYGYDVCHDKGSVSFQKGIKQNALQTLIDKEIIAEYAVKHHIAVSALDFNRNWALIYHSKFGTQRILKTFVRRYGITVPELKARIRNDMLREDVTVAVTAHMPTTAPAINLARIQTLNSAGNVEITNLIKDKIPFVQIAKHFEGGANGPCASGCGDLGWIPTTFLPSYQKYLATSKIGKPIGPIKLQKNGFEWYEVLGRESQYRLTQKQQVTMRDQILFPQWLTAQEKHASVKRYVAV